MTYFPKLVTTIHMQICSIDLKKFGTTIFFDNFDSNLRLDYLNKALHSQAPL